MQTLVKRLAFSLVPVTVLVLLAEVGLRLAGYPSGRFFGMYPDSHGLYPPNAEITMSYGAVPYVVETNSIGFRGPEVKEAPAPGSIRIATIGDSITDGFFVENEATWQRQLERELRSQADLPAVEVVSAAHGGGSIDKELWLLKEFVVPLRPDLVILTFVTNDIADIAGVPRADLLRYDETQRTSTKQLLKSLFQWNVTRLAIGEASYHAYLSLLSPAYRQRQDAADGILDDARYAIADGDQFSRNAQRFERRYGRADGRLLEATLDEETRKSVEDYLFALTEFAGIVRDQGSEMLLVYYPAYTQIYGDASRTINERLAIASAELGIDFLDLTDAFRKAGENTVLHLAPLDFHPNPAGNRVIAASIAEHLLRSELATLAKK